MSKRVLKAVKPSAKPVTKQKSNIVSVPDSNESATNKSSKKPKSKTTGDIALSVSKVVDVKPKRDRSKRTHEEFVIDAQGKLGALLDHAFNRGYAKGYAIAKMSSK